MTTSTTKMGWFLRGTAVLALTVVGSAAMAQNIAVPGGGSDEKPASEAAGGIENTVTLTGDYGADTYEVTAFENVDVEAPAPDLDITKSAAIVDADGNAKLPGSPAAVGDTITYTYEVLNEGNVQMTGLQLVDDHNGTGTLSAIVCDDIDEGTNTGNTAGDTEITAPAANHQIPKLGSLDSVTCTATYVVQQGDIDTLQAP